MTTNVELDEDEVKEAIQLYLSEKNLDVALEDIDIEIQRGMNKGSPAQRTSPGIRKAVCKDVTETDE